jgi:hypothetical protein
MADGYGGVQREQNAGDTNRQGRQPIPCHCVLRHVLELNPLGFFSTRSDHCSAVREELLAACLNGRRVGCGELADEDVGVSMG